MHPAQNEMGSALVNAGPGENGVCIGLLQCFVVAFFKLPILICIQRNAQVHLQVLGKLSCWRASLFSDKNGNI